VRLFWLHIVLMPQHASYRLCRTEVKHRHVVYCCWQASPLLLWYATLSASKLLWFWLSLRCTGMQICWDDPRASHGSVSSKCHVLMRTSIFKTYGVSWSMCSIHSNLFTGAVATLRCPVLLTGGCSCLPRRLQLGAAVALGMRMYLQERGKPVTAPAHKTAEPNGA
jgi:hypothetical protein